MCFRSADLSRYDFQGGVPVCLRILSFLFCCRPPSTATAFLDLRCQTQLSLHPVSHQQVLRIGRIANIFDPALLTNLQFFSKCPGSVAQVDFRYDGSTSRQTNRLASIESSRIDNIFDPALLTNLQFSSNCRANPLPV